MSRARILAGAAVAVLVTCAAFVARERWGARSGTRAQRDTPAALEGVMVGGCDEVLAGGTCVVVAGTALGFFVPTTAEAHVQLHGAPLAAKERVVLDGGQRITVTLPATAPAAPRAHPAERTADDAAAALEADVDVDVDVDVDAPARHTRLRIARALAAPPWLVTARAAKANGDVEAARAALASAPAAGTSERDAADAASLRARLTLLAGDSERAAGELARSAEEQRRLGRDSRAADDETARAFVLIEMRELAAAEEALSRAERDAAHYPEGRANVAYHRGDLARVRGELRHAVELLAAASDVADRVGYVRLLGLAVQLRALVLVDTGRAADALELLDPRRGLASRLASSLAPCDRADLANNRGWAALVLAANAADHPPGAAAAVTSALAPLREAERGYVECKNPRRVANARVNLAWAHLLAGDTARAKESLRGAREVQPRLDALVALFADELEARIALSEGAPGQAEARFRDVAERARALALPLDEAHAEEGRARALFAQKKLRASDEAAARAESLVEALAAEVALGEGRGTFRMTRDAAARLRMELALAERDDARALAVARRSRARAGADLTRLASDASRSPAAREARAAAALELTKAREALLAEAQHDWELTADAAARAVAARRERAVRMTSLYEERLRSATAAEELAHDGREHVAPVAAPALAPGELDLVIHPTLDGWVAFAVTSRGARVTRLPVHAGAPPAELARLLVEPFDAELASARRVRVLASGAMRAVDVHALPWRGRPLGAAVTVVYAADVPRGPAGVGRPGPTATATATAPHAPGGEALVVADPRVDLRAAQHEGALAKAALARSGRPVHAITGPEATRAALLERLGRASFFHYAGHATHAGPDGWESALLLSRGTMIGVADLVTLERAPAVVVLSACDAAREVGAAGEEQVGIAQALLATHASVVVAATRPVDDAATSALMTAFYTEIAEGVSPEEALARAQTALREASPAADWAAFRALVHGTG